jgi:hypothetical protein
MSSRPRIKTFLGKLQSGSLKDSGVRRNDTLLIINLTVH